MKKVYEKANKFGISVEFWEQQRLADFLDTTPDGQYLRKIYLGIKAELLSEPLLGDLCQRSLELYKKNLFVTNRSNLVFREITNCIEEGIHNNIFSIQFLIGEAGFGKTVLAYQTLQQHIISDGYGIWLPAESIKDSISLENALDKVLRSLYPNLLPDSGRIALQLLRKRFQAQNSRFLVIVDDLNRVASPEKLLNLVSNWAKPIPSNDSYSQDLSSPFLIVCPLWPHIYRRIYSNFNKSSWVHVVFTEKMTLTEAQSAIHATALSIEKTITSLEAISISEKLDRDPLLIGLFNMLPDTENVVPEDIIERFITQKINELVAKSNLFFSEYQEALSSLTFRMLQNRKLNPLWREIQDWFREFPDILNALRELAKQEQLCRLTVMSDQERFDFRHDRLREALLVKRMIKILEDPEPQNDVLWEPFYAEIMGQAILRTHQNLEFLQQIRDNLPLALFEALRHIGTPFSDYHHYIIEEIKKWTDCHVKTGTAPNSVLKAICLSLIRTDSPTVLEITEIVPQNRLVLLARLRNGCARSGALYCGDSGLGTNDFWRDQILNHVKQRHTEQFILQLRQLLRASEISDKERKGALYLAGWFEYAEFQNEIKVCWEQTTDKTEILAEAIYASSRCCKTGFQQLLDPMFSYWASIREEEKESMKYYDHIAHKLHFGMHNVSSEVVDYFITQSTRYQPLRRFIASVCGFIDTKNALEFAIREGITNDRKLPETLLSFVKKLWEDPKNVDSGRDRAFHLWLANINQKQLEILRKIPESSPLFYRAIRARIQFGDYSVGANLRSILKKDYSLLWEVYPIWDEEIKTIVHNHLTSLKDFIPKDFSGGRNDHYFFLSRLLTMIPKDDAEMLLDKNWKHLGYSRLFILTALYVGTPRCLELADLSIKQCPKEISIFEHLYSVFGKEKGRHEYLTVQHVKRLLPYLDLLEEAELSDLAEMCQYLHIPEWSQQHIAHRLSEKSRKWYHPTDKDLYQELDELVEDKHCEWRMKHWLEEFDKRHDSKDRALSIVEQWLASNSTLKGLQIVSACLQHIGTRKDLSLLDK